jgi:predicted small lipoprotein YifL
VDCRTKDYNMARDWVKKVSGNQMKKLLGGAVVLLAAFTLTACGPYTLTEVEKLRVDAGARDYADKSGGKFISCSGQDSDGDSYVTCTLQDKTGATTAILCSYNQVGCKPKGT